MALELDGLLILRNIAAHPDTFPAIKGEAAKIARTLVLKQLKAKATTLSSLRDIRKALGAEFLLLLDGMTDSEVKSLVSKVDKHYAGLKSAGPDQHRRQISDLAEGNVQAADKPTATRTAKPKRLKTQPAPPERLSSKAMAAVRKNPPSRDGNA